MQASGIGMRRTGRLNLDRMLAGEGAENQKGNPAGDARERSEAEGSPPLVSGSVNAGPLSATTGSSSL